MKATSPVGHPQDSRQTKPRSPGSTGSVERPSSGLGRIQSGVAKPLNRLQKKVKDLKRLGGELHGLEPTSETRRSPEESSEWKRISGEITAVRRSYTAAHLQTMTGGLKAETEASLGDAQRRLKAAHDTFRSSIQKSIVKGLTSSDYISIREGIRQFEAKVVPDILIKAGVLKGDPPPTVKQVTQALLLVEGYGDSFEGKFTSQNYRTETRGWLGAVEHYINGLESGGLSTHRPGEYRVRLDGPVPMAPGMASAKIDAREREINALMNFEGVSDSVRPIDAARFLNKHIQGIELAMRSLRELQEDLSQVRKKVDQGDLSHDNLTQKYQLEKLVNVAKAREILRTHGCDIEPDGTVGMDQFTESR